MVLFPFEPGDGYSYRVLFDRVAAPTPFIPYYTVFGIAVGSSDSGVWYAFDTDQVSSAVFYDHLFSANASVSWDEKMTAWRLWLALTGQADDTQAQAQLPPWRADWRQQLPTAALG